jgi:hypothetical protein
VYALGGFAGGLAFACSLPMLTKWGDRLAARVNDDEVAGVRKGSGERPTTPRPAFQPSTLDRHGAAAAAACLAAGVPAPYVPPDRKKAS